MARQRPSIAIDLPFTYWVFGRPVSIQNDDGAKPKALPKWRGAVTTALVDALEAHMGRRGAILIEGRVEVRIYWLSLDPDEAAQPDIDNVLKPLVDAFNLRIIRDDRQVHRIVAEKASLNEPPADVRDIMAEIQDDERFVRVGEVLIVRLVEFTQEYRP